MVRLAAQLPRRLLVFLQLVFLLLPAVSRAVVLLLACQALQALLAVVEQVQVQVLLHGSDQWGLRRSVVHRHPPSCVPKNSKEAKIQG